MDFKFRKANFKDIDELEKLIEISAKSINSSYYSELEINAALGNAWTVDKQLILDETYWVVETQNGKLIGCGGWSKRRLLFGKSESLNFSESKLNPDIEPARIRAFFVHPTYTRMGIGKGLLKKCENEAELHGFKTLELVATLSGEKLYSAYGFKEIKTYEVELGNGITNKVVAMNKTLA
ncbi:GNAT family N-acetyltransferase [Aurantibacter sp.]|uniref:GNAT family N-acetyltransferase n=1 Tax=Aurantibacter sp. TaxID=2807103 RepID=UPI003262EA72